MAFCSDNHHEHRFTFWGGGFEKTPLINACQYGGLDEVRMILENDRETIHAQFMGKAAIHCAVERQSIDIVGILLEAGANVNHTTFGFEDTPLHLAAETSNVAMVELLLEAGADTSLQNCHHNTPLQVAKNIYL